MPPVQAPPIDDRTHGDLVAELETLLPQLTAGEVDPDSAALAGALLDQDVTDGGGLVAAAGTPVDAALAERIAAIQGLGQVKVRGWQPPGPLGPPDAASALVRIFSRMAELVIARLNQVPDRNFLAFLDLIGTRPEPPQPARVPLTFNLAAGSTADALVPARTPVAATPLEGDAAPVLFETERSLVVTRSQLVAAWTREPGRDLVRDCTAVATGQAAGVFPPFRGEQPIRHFVYLGDAGALGAPERKTVEIQVETLLQDVPWLADVAWEAWNGTAWQPLAGVQSDFLGFSRTVTIPDVEAIPPSEVGGITSSWIRGRLTLPLPQGELTEPDDGVRFLWRRGLTPDAAWAASGEDLAAVDLGRPPAYPFGETAPVDAFYLALAEAFDRRGALALIDIQLVEDRLPEPSGNLSLVWEFWNGSAWTAIGGSLDFTPSAPVAQGQPSGPFLVSGTVGLTVPNSWQPSLLGDTTARWLRVRIASGDFGPAGTPDFRPPVVERLAVSYRWPLPVIGSLLLSTTVERQAPEEQLIPDRGFSNQVPLDLNKDFLPFGEKPRPGDVLYLACDEAFSKPDAKITLSVALTNVAEGGTPPPAAPSADLILDWEFWDGSQWQLLGSSGPGLNTVGTVSNPYLDRDDTLAFTEEAVVSFRVPESLAPLEINGEKRRFVRVRLAAGNYGKEARYDPAGEDQNGLPIYRLVPATFRPPSIRSLRLAYTFQSPLVPPQQLLRENDLRVEAAKSSGFVGIEPFVPPEDTRPTLYLGFERPGESIGFSNRSAALYFGVEGALYDPATEQTGVLEEASVVWEYWNGERWQRLGTRDETRGFTRRGLVTFIGPPDFRASTELGHRAFWLRARWERGSYAVEPEIRRVLLNTTWAAHAHTVEGEVLGSSRGERGQVLRTIFAPVLAGQQLEVVEPEELSAPDLAALAAEEGEDAQRVVADAAGRQTEIRVRWHEVPDFYGSGPRSRHYTLDRQTGEVRFGDGLQGLIPPPGRNNVRMAVYLSGGGLAGNRPAGNLTQLRGTVPYVDSVFQLEPAAGGAAAESPSALVLRGPRTLRHRDRAVAPADFEDLAVQASTEVARARCIAATGGHDAGQVGLIVVPRSGAAKPVPSLELLGRVESYLQARVSPALDLWVVGPDWLEVTVDAEVAPSALEAATDVQTAVLERLSTFLHPLTGGVDGEGWAFGRKPYRSDLFALIESTPGVDHVLRLQVTEVAREGGARPERFLVYSGEHQITLTGNTDESASDGSFS
jgi:Baseplate J-like protein